MKPEDFNYSDDYPRDIDLEYLAKWTYYSARFTDKDKRFVDVFGFVPKGDHGSFDLAKRMCE